MAYSNFYGWFYSVRQQAASGIASVWHFNPSRWYFLVILLLQIGAWLEALFIYHNLSGDLLVLHYNVDFGIDLVGDPRQIFLYPIIGLGILAFNTIVAATLYRQRDFRVFAHFLLAAALVSALFLNLVLLFIYLINFR